MHAKARSGGRTSSHESARTCPAPLPTIARPSPLQVVVPPRRGSIRIALAIFSRELDAAGDLRSRRARPFQPPAARRCGRRRALLCARQPSELAVPVFVETRRSAARAAREAIDRRCAARAARHECFGRARASVQTRYAIAVGHARRPGRERFCCACSAAPAPRGLGGGMPSAQRGTSSARSSAAWRDDLRAWLRRTGDRIRRGRYECRIVSIPANRIRADLIPLPEVAVQSRSWTCSPAKPTSPARRGGMLRGGGQREIEGRIVEPTNERLRHRPGGGAGRRRAACSASCCGGRCGARQDGRPVRVPITSRRPCASWKRTVATPRCPATGWNASATTLVLTGGRGRRTPIARSSPIGVDPLPPNTSGITVYPREVELAEAGWHDVGGRDGIRRQRSRPENRGHQWHAVSVAIVRRDLCHGSLAVRNRRPGDRFTPPGLSGRKKLQDLFRRSKSAQKRPRSACRLVVDEADRIVWVAGRIDGAFQVTDPAQAVLTLRLRPKKARFGTTGLGWQRWWRLCVTSTLKSLMFWVVLVVIGVLIWNFSTEVPAAHERTDCVPASSCRGPIEEAWASVTITGQRPHRPHARSASSSTYVPSSCTTRLVNKLTRSRHCRDGEGADRQPVGDRCRVLVGARSC